MGVLADITPRVLRAYHRYIVAPVTVYLVACYTFKEQLNQSQFGVGSVVEVVATSVNPRVVGSNHVLCFHFSVPLYSYVFKKWNLWTSRRF